MKVSYRRPQWPSEWQIRLALSELDSGQEVVFQLRDKSEVRGTYIDTAGSTIYVMDSAVREIPIDVLGTILIEGTESGPGE